MKYRTPTFNRCSIGVLECLYITPHIKINENMGHKHCFTASIFKQEKIVFPTSFSRADRYQNFVDQKLRQSKPAKKSQ